MQNILSGSESPLSSAHSLNSSDNVLSPFCQWIIQRHAEQIPPLCFQLRNMTHHHGAREPETSYVSHRHNSPYGEAIENSFATGSGVIGTLGCVLLILVLIAVLSCFKEHRRIKVCKLFKIIKYSVPSPFASSKNLIMKYFSFSQPAS